MASESTTTPSLESRITRDSPAKDGTDATSAEPKASTSVEGTDTSSEPKASTSVDVPAEDGTTDDGRSLGNRLEEPEYDVNVTLADLQHDPNNPLFSIKSFEDLKLSQPILEGLLRLNFQKPSKIQERALPLLLHNPPTNLIGQSQSGTGKTAAFVINILSRIDLSLQQPQALVLAPSRELARQIVGVIESMAVKMEGLKVFCAVPDPARPSRVNQHIVVGTPGTVVDMIRRRIINVSNMKVLVLDEADNMLDQQGLGDQCKRVKLSIPSHVQVTLFSATFPDEVLGFADIFAPKANKITLKRDELTVDGIKQFFFDCESEEEKYDVLLKFYGLLTISSSIVFCKRRDTAMEIERRMVADGHQVAHLSGALEGSERDVVIDRFRSGAAKVLITTNVLARGIDVSLVTMVVNYDIPEANGKADFETYLHRIGRTGRFGRVGVAINLVSDKRQWLMLRDIAEHFGIKPEPLKTDDWDNVEETVKRVIKSRRAGKTTKQLQGGDGADDA
ncbi:ATP-dependent RNA helicase DBP5 [Trichodelitschia bisporula]|uniref:RNA helicase n=1 Tax=Trichodelitschia bisporula TaxID=703511 RepID=A0A6G1HPG9_9PEZI|nr:ATP-dependent RNA helicase DBP5 [Trichodelitschia bisporula]